MNFPNTQPDQEAIELAKIVLHGDESQPGYYSRLLLKAQDIKQQIISGELDTEVVCSQTQNS